MEELRQLGGDHSSEEESDSHVSARKKGAVTGAAEQVLLAAENNDMQMLCDLIAKDPTLVNARDSDQYSPLHRACYNNHADVVKFLLKNGANPAAQTADGWQPLHCAAKWNSYECAVALLNAGADINAVSNGGLTPLHLAASEQHTHEMVELLLWQKSIDCEKTNSAGDTAKQVALRSGKLADLFEMVEPSVTCLYEPPDS